MIPRPPTYPLFPYTTLFRSPRTHLQGLSIESGDRRARLRDGRSRRRAALIATAHWNVLQLSTLPDERPLRNHSWRRSEEHTSELQSQFHLVCRLLLAKKKPA